ncbi:hypothetical protein [Nonomuraea sp. NPDC049784]|uniref:hypothetical protein n=1 Tax=Nonomuraea sp. NPDC049784 TaxID=3154361 RepID=UPI0033F83E55
MSLSDVIRNIAKTVTNKDELKEKAKDLPLLVIQTTLSAAGQALLVVDRVKNSIKSLGNKEEREEEEAYESRTPAADQVAAAPAAEQDKPARKEPVIFAPRPGSAEPNGVAKTKPDPVIFTPAGKSESAATANPETPAAPKPAGVEEPAAAAEPKATVVEEAAAEPEAASAPTTAAEPAVAEEPAEVEAKAAVVEEPAVAEKPAEVEAKAAVVEETPAAKPKATRRTKKPAAAKKPAEEPVAAPEPAAAAEPASAGTPAPGDLAEPLPGYSELTVASLRARMRGKTAEQIGDFLTFEKATKARPEVIKMFENRLAKLQAGE